MKNLGKSCLKSVFSLFLVLVMAVGLLATRTQETAAAKFTVTLKGNGGKINGENSTRDSVSSGSYSYAFYTFPAALPVRDGYYFAGWSKKESTSIVDYYPEQKIKMTSSGTYYAVWVKKNGVCQVTYDGNGGTWIGKYDNAQKYTSYVAAGQKMSLTKNKFSAADRKFGGWSLNPGGKVSYSDGKTITVSKNITLYARWKVKVHVHPMQALPYSSDHQKPSFKQGGGTIDLWEYENVRLKDAMFYKDIPEGYYWADVKGNMLSDETVITKDLNIFMWPYGDTITLKWADTSAKVLVYTGLPIAGGYFINSMENISGGYPVGASFSPFNNSPNKEYVVGWTLKGGKMKEKTVSPGLRLVCRGKEYDATVVTQASNAKAGNHKLYMSAFEIRAMYELSEEAYQKRMATPKDTVSNIISPIVHFLIGSKMGDVLAMADAVYGLISGEATALTTGYYLAKNNKQELTDLHGNLEAIIAGYEEELKHEELIQNYSLIDNYIYVRVTYKVVPKPNSTNSAGILIPTEIVLLP